MQPRIFVSIKSQEERDLWIAQLAVRRVTVLSVFGGIAVDIEKTLSYQLQAFARWALDTLDSTVRPQCMRYDPETESYERGLTMLSMHLEDLLHPGGPRKCILMVSIYSRARANDLLSLKVLRASVQRIARGG